MSGGDGSDEGQEPRTDTQAKKSVTEENTALEECSGLEDKRSQEERTCPETVLDECTGQEETTNEEEKTHLNHPKTQDKAKAHRTTPTTGPTSEMRRPETVTPASLVGPITVGTQVSDGTNKPAAEDNQVLKIEVAQVPAQNTQVTLPEENQALEPKKTKVRELEQGQVTASEETQVQASEKTQLLEPVKTQTSEPEKIQVIESEKTQVIEPENTQAAKPEETQVPAPEEIQVPPTKGTQGPEPTQPLVPEPEKTHVPEKIKVLELEKTQVLESEKTQVLEPEKTQALEPKKTQVLESEETQVIEPEKTQALEPEKTRVLEINSSNATKDKKTNQIEVSEPIKSPEDKEPSRITETDNDEDKETLLDDSLGYIELPSYVPKNWVPKRSVSNDTSDSATEEPQTTLEELNIAEYMQSDVYSPNVPHGSLEYLDPFYYTSSSRDEARPVFKPIPGCDADYGDNFCIALPSYNDANYQPFQHEHQQRNTHYPPFQHPNQHQKPRENLDCTNFAGENYAKWTPRRQKLDKDISVESCPDVVLQTLEGDKPEVNKNKKTVTFLLPPEHWDSLISLREHPLGGYPQSGYAELDGSLLPPNGQDPYRNTPSPGLHGLPQDRYVRWRDPDLHEVIDFLSNPNNVVKANAAAYLQHLCYMDDPTKQKTRILGGIPPLVALLTHDLPELHRNACGALRNLSYGRQNDENKRAIRDASGIPSLVRLLRKTPDNEIKELVTGILWNLSSCEDLKHNIIDDGLTVLVSHVIIPCSGWDGGEVERDPNVDVWWSTVFKNASGVLRNVSSAGEYARTKLRQCNGLVDSLLTVIKSAIQGSNHDNKSVENCVCILRNLSYRCQEVDDPNYDKNQPPTQSRATATAKGDNLGCFGGSRKKKEAVGGGVKEGTTGQRSTGPRNEPLRGMELLWQPEVVVSSYLALLSDCSNPETLEAAAGALQNLAACYWQPSIDVRAAVRKEKGLPILVELLRMEVDRVVCAVATALRNLAIDQRNKELIGKYAMRDLVQKLPSGNTRDSGTSDETIAAVLATLNEVIKKSAEFSRSLLDVGGVERLLNMTRHRGRYSVRVVKFASQVLFSMWGHQELREVYKKAGWKEQDFVSKSVAARNASGGGANSPTANNTLNRPMASQGGTRYEDRTIQRGQKPHHQYNRGEEVAMANMGYSGDGVVGPGVRGYQGMQGKPGEPVYAKVNRDKKRNRQYDALGPHYGTLGDDWGAPMYAASPAASPSFNNNNTNANNNNANNGVDNSVDSQAGGDSWV